MAQSTGKDWRELCAAATEESDADKLLSLVHEILRAFEEGDRKQMLPNRSDAFAPKP